MDNNDDTSSVLFGEIPINGTDTRKYSMRKSLSNGSTADVDIKNHINSMRSDDTSAVINIDMDGKSNFHCIRLFSLQNHRTGEHTI